MAKISTFLEEKANQLKRNLDKKDVSIPSIIKREIALTAEQIDRLQALHKDQLDEILQAECYVNTELMQMEQRTPRYSPYRFPEREKLQRRLLQIGAERRRLAARLEDKLQPLEDRLLSLINKHEQVSDEDLSQ